MSAAFIALLHRESKKGSVFFLSLWVLVFLSVIAVLCAGIVNQQVVVLKKLELREQLYQIARAGILTAIDEVGMRDAADPHANVETLNDRWADQPGVFKRIAINGGFFDVIYTQRQPLTREEEKRYGVVDEGRKINLNYADESVLVRLLHKVGRCDSNKAIVLARAILDWRDPDDTVLGSDPALSERNLYHQAGYAYEPENTFFDSVDELLLVKDMDAQTFISIRDFLTVYTDRSVNINTAPPEVLDALGLSASLIDSIMQYRCGLNMREGDSDDVAFERLDRIVDDLKRKRELSQQDEDVLRGLIADNRFTIQSFIFSAVAVGTLENEQMYGTIKCIFNQEGHRLFWSAAYYTASEGTVVNGIGAT